MNEYISWYNKLDKVVKVIFAFLGIFCLLYRLFYVIREKGTDTSRLIYLVLNFVPIISTIIWLIDIVYAFKNDVPLSFGQIANEAE